MSIRLFLRIIFVLMIVGFAAFLIFTAYRTANKLNDNLENRVRVIEKGMAEKGQE